MTIDFNIVKQNSKASRQLARQVLEVVRDIPPKERTELANKIMRVRDLNNHTKQVTGVQWIWAEVYEKLLFPNRQSIQGAFR